MKARKYLWSRIKVALRRLNHARGSNCRAFYAANASRRDINRSCGGISETSGRRHFQCHRTRVIAAVALCAEAIEEPIAACPHAHRARKPHCCSRMSDSSQAISAAARNERHVPSIAGELLAAASRICITATATFNGQSASRASRLHDGNHGAARRQ